MLASQRPISYMQLFPFNRYPRFELTSKPQGRLGIKDAGTVFKDLASNSNDDDEDLSSRDEESPPATAMVTAHPSSFPSHHSTQAVAVALPSSDDDDDESLVAAAVVGSLDPPSPESSAYKNPAPKGTFTAAILEMSAAASVARTPVW